MQEVEFTPISAGFRRQRKPVTMLSLYTRLSFTFARADDFDIANI